MRIETREQLQAIRKEAKAKIDATPIRILFQQLYLESFLDALYHLQS